MTLKAWAERWSIPTEHFDPDAARRRALRRTPIPLEDVLVLGSTYSRGKLKERLYESGLKHPVCELCGQGQTWKGRRMALILDHVNGDARDNRLENLQIVCPNCAATLDTHCGRKLARPLEAHPCKRCGRTFMPKDRRQRYCSRDCGQRWDRSGRSLPGARRAERPPYEQLVAEIAATSWSAVGRKYGVSDNAIRKWIRAYERERASVEADGAVAGGVPGPVGVAWTEVDAAEPAVDRRAGGMAGEDGGAVGRELVAAAGEVDERAEVAGDGVDRGVAEPRWVLVGRDGEEELVGRERPVGERLEDLALGAGEARADVGELLEQALEAANADPGARVR